MSERHHRRSTKSSRKHNEDSSKPKIKSNSYQNDLNKKRQREGAKTPPLPSKNVEMEDLLKRRFTLKRELERLEKGSNHDSKYSRSSYEAKKRKQSENSGQDRKHSKLCYESHSVKDSKTKEKSPDLQEIHLDSEDEENIIQQRRQQRKQLLEKLNSNETHVALENKTEINVKNPGETSTETSEINPSKMFGSDKSKDTTSTDMFSEKDDFVHKNMNVIRAKDENNSQLTDNWDDDEGYYIIRSGDVINKRYTLKYILGQGVFANVVRAHDTSQGNSPVAIKIVRKNELMYTTSLKEINILKEINEADPENKYHCVRFITYFMHKGHLCLVLESLHMDMRTVLRKYGKHHGLHMKALVSYSRQLMLALRLLKKIGIVHADIKPDNILVNEKKNVLKLCDFGSAAKLDENEPTPYLVSRFYRAPEIILGVPYSHSIDIWSAACTIYEMATGKIMFTGASNNKMLKCFMDLKGKISSKLIKKGRFKDQHFNYNNNFLLHKKDEFSGRDKVVEISNINITRDLHKELQKCSKNMYLDEKKLTQLKELLDKMFALDPNHRSTVSDCLKHPFIQEQLELHRK